MGSFFKFGQAVLEIFEFYCSKKQGFFRQDLEGTYISEMAPKDDFWRVFCNFLGINTHNLVKNDLKLKNKSLFEAKFYRAWHEKIHRSQSSDIWSLGLGPRN